MTDNDYDLKGQVPESWRCIDCGVNTHPGSLDRAKMEKAVKTAKAVQGEKWSVELTWTTSTEVYTVWDAVWKAAGMEPMGGCLCIRCLEKRLGRELRPRDFNRDHVFNDLRFPGSYLRWARLSADDYEDGGGGVLPGLPGGAPMQ